ncbi:MAG: hypothetical protein M4579_002714 [Chaenotheca gracillima]|nr:MAG: hypothetical protein M4579_002714 [Chaenotheca gracillima]
MALSAPMTPEGAQSASRASTPPSVRDGSSPVQLTPKSKIKALMASIDDNSSSDSDAEQAAQSNTSRGPILKDSTAPHRNSSDMSLQAEIGEETKQDESQAPMEEKDTSNDEDDEVVARPKGRLAARMQARHAENQTTRGEGEAYERIKKQLMEDSNKGEDSDVIMGETSQVNNGESLETATPEEPEEELETVRSQEPSPGLFVSPDPSPMKQKGSTPTMDDSDSDLPTNPQGNSRFLALVNKKRAERQAREAEASAKDKELEKHSKKAAKSRRQSVVPEEGSDTNSLDEERLTQQVRPTRKASKKALEEMNRETQRIARNMHLAHQATTRKKISKQSLFDRFNYRPVAPESATADTAAVVKDASSSAAASDVDGTKSTPPTSPAAHPEESPKRQTLTSDSAAFAATPASNSRTVNDQARSINPFNKGLKLDKGKGKAIESTTNETPRPAAKGTQAKRKQLSVRPPVRTSAPDADDSESDLEILPRPAAKESIWDRVPQKQEVQSRSMYSLRMLANLTSPGKQRTQKGASMSVSELQVHLQQQARRQAAKEREDRIGDLKARGIFIQTNEEREKNEFQIEDLLDKARKDAAKISKQEKKEREDNAGEKEEDSEGDADWAEAGNEADQSGSEGSAVDSEEDDEAGSVDDVGEEGDDNGEDEEDEVANIDANKISAVVDVEASEDGDEETEGRTEAAEKDEEEEEANFAEEPSKSLARRRGRVARIVSDDEEEYESVPSPVAQKTPKSALKTPRSAIKTPIPGLPMSDPPLGLTQIFAGTMGESQSNQNSPSTANDGVGQDQDSLEFLRRLPPTMPNFDSLMDADFSQDMVKNSQMERAESAELNDTQFESNNDRIHLDFSQSQIHDDSLRDSNPLLATQQSEFPDPTQDLGFVESSPLRDRFVEVPPSTIETVLLDSQTGPVKKKGRLRTRHDANVFSDEEDAGNSEEVDESDVEKASNVFDVMRKVNKQQPTENEDLFDKKQSKAREMVEELAEESEDEYAGLGGASDDGSADEADAQMLEEMMDDGAHDVDERQIAALYANKARQDDEKQVQKLFKDITSGMLRRKNGADYDLSDSDDGGEARRRMKRRDFAKMRKALLEDENVGKIANNPKKMAFLRAIEDHDEEDRDLELDFLDEIPQEDSQVAIVPNSQATSSNVLNSQDVAAGKPGNANLQPSLPLKRKHDSTENDENRPPPNMRERRNYIPRDKKPSTLSEVRESLSNLIDGPNAMGGSRAGYESSSSISEGEGENAESGETSSTHGNPRRGKQASNAAVIDRLLIKRNSSFSSGNSAVEHATRNQGRLAFHSAVPNGSTSSNEFRVPSLLRRATSSHVSAQLEAAAASVGTDSKADSLKRSTVGGGGATIKKGVGSSVNAFAKKRENDTGRAVVEREERRREGRIRKIGESRRGVFAGLTGGS